MAKDGNFPESIIPSMRSNFELRTSDTLANRRHDVWGEEGKHSAEEEYDLFFPELWEQCITKLKQHGGRLKIVAFGSGYMQGVMDLKSQLEAFCAKCGLKPRIEIVEYALTKKLAIAGLVRRQEFELVDEVFANKPGDVRVHAGPLEVKDIRDAAEADVMVSVFGPFWHADSEEACIEMIDKTAKKMAPGGRGFLHLNGRFVDRVRADLPQETTADNGAACHLEVCTPTPPPNIMVRRSYVLIKCDEAK